MISTETEAILQLTGQCYKGQLSVSMVSVWSCQSSPLTTRENDLLPSPERSNAWKTNFPRRKCDPLSTKIHFPYITSRRRRELDIVGWM